MDPLLINIMAKADLQAFKDVEKEVLRIGRITTAVNDSLSKRNSWVNSFDGVAESAKRAGKELALQQKQIIDSFKTNTANKFYDDLVAKNKETAQAGMAIVANMKERADAQKEINKESKRFKGELMSMMFFGMALQRVFGGFLTSAFQTYSKITEGTKEANNAMTRLQASWEFFKFSMINVLMNSAIFVGFIDFIIKIIDWVSSLSDGWKAIFVTLIIILAGAGMLLTIIGAIGLYVDTMGAGWLTIAKSVGLASKEATAFSASMAGALGIFALIVAALGFIGYLIYKLGGPIEFMKSLWRGVGRVIMLMVSAVAGVWSELFNIILKGWNMVVSAIQGVADTVISVVNSIIDAWNTVMDDNISKVPPLDLSGWNASVKKFGQSFKDTYSDMMTAYLDFENKTIASEKGYLQGYNPFGEMTGGVDLSKTMTGQGQKVNSDNMVVVINNENGTTSRYNTTVSETPQQSLERLGWGQYGSLLPSR